MSTNTTNYGLTKPAQSDFYNVDDFNGNFDIIDEEIKKREMSIDDLKALVGDTSLAGLAIPTITALAKYLQGVGEAAKISAAGFHNSFYRGKSLGNQLTAAQSAAIRAGTFDDMYIGDYWTINGVTWRIADFDYWYQTGDTACNTHHVVVVPDAPLYNHVMNDTNVTTGAYVGSKMYTSGLNQAKSTAQTAFGSGHILSHRMFLQNATTNGYATGHAWYDSTVDLMTEEMVYGAPIFETAVTVSGSSPIVPSKYTVENRQLKLFALDPQRLVAGRQWWWLRNVVNAAYFANVDSLGYCDYGNASGSNGVRPAIAIY